MSNQFSFPEDFKKNNPIDSTTYSPLTMKPKPKLIKHKTSDTVTVWFKNDLQIRTNIYAGIVGEDLPVSKLNSHSYFFSIKDSSAIHILPKVGIHPHSNNQKTGALISHMAYYASDQHLGVRIEYVEPLGSLFLAFQGVSAPIFGAIIASADPLFALKEFSDKEKISLISHPPDFPFNDAILIAEKCGIEMTYLESHSLFLIDSDVLKKYINKELSEIPLVAKQAAPQEDTLSPYVMLSNENTFTTNSTATATYIDTVVLHKYTPGDVQHTPDDVEESQPDSLAAIKGKDLLEKMLSSKKKNPPNAGPVPKGHKFTHLKNT